MKTECVCKTTDLLKDYITLHERIKALYKMLEIYRYICWYHYESTFPYKKNYWKEYYDIVKETINAIITRDLKCKEDMENVSIRNNKIRDIKNEIKRHHRLQSNIQNVLNIVKGTTHFININRRYNTEEVPSQFKNDMNYTYYCVSYYDKLLVLGE